MSCHCFQSHIYDFLKIIHNFFLNGVKLLHSSFMRNFNFNVKFQWIFQSNFTDRSSVSITTLLFCNPIEGADCFYNCRYPYNIYQSSLFLHLRILSSMGWFPSFYCHRAFKVKDDFFENEREEKLTSILKISMQKLKGQCNYNQAISASYISQDLKPKSF